MDRLSAGNCRNWPGEIFDDGLRKVTAYPLEHPWNAMAIVLKNMINRVH